MTVIIKQSDSTKQMDGNLAKARGVPGKPVGIKPFDPFQFLGKLKDVFGDGVEYQHQLRDEWNYSISE